MDEKIPLDSSSLANYWHKNSGSYGTMYEFLFAPTTINTLNGKKQVGKDRTRQLFNHVQKLYCGDQTSCIL